MDTPFRDGRASSKGRARTQNFPLGTGLSALLAVLPAATACGADATPEAAIITEKDFGTSRDEIIGGDPATATTWGALVTVGSGCTGALLSDEWLITARHCISTFPGEITNPKLKITRIDGATRTAIEAFYMPGTFTGNPKDPGTPEVDVALLRVDVPFQLDFDILLPSAIHYLYPYANAGLAGGPEVCAGFGIQSFAQPGFGVPAWASIDVTETTPRKITMEPDDDGQEIFGPGDSGGPCTALIGGGWFQFRVQSLSLETTKDGRLTAVKHSQGAGTESFRDWALGIMGFGVGLYSERNYLGNAQTVANSTLSVSRVGDKAISSVRVPPGWQVKLWDTPIPGIGNSLTLTKNTPNMPSGWHDRVSSVEVLQNGVQIFRDASFAGANRTLAPGRYNTADLGADFNNSISSLKIPSDWRVRAFIDSGFKGFELELYGSNIGSLGSFYNDDISSLVVEQPVTVFSDSFYFGQYQTFWEGSYDFTDMRVPNDSISSIVVPAGFKIQVFEHTNFGGASATFTSSQSFVPDEWNDRISSVRVTRN